MVFWRRGKAKGEDIREVIPTSEDGRSKLRNAFTQELKQSVRELEETRHTKRRGRFDNSPFHGKKSALSKEQRDELRMSVHNLNTRNLHRSEASTSHGARFTISDEQKKEIQISARDMNSKSERRSGPSVYRHTMSKEQKDELRESVHNMHARRTNASFILDRADTEQSRSLRETNEMLGDSNDKVKQGESSLTSEQGSEQKVSNEAERKKPEGEEAALGINGAGMRSIAVERKRFTPELFDELRKSIHSKSTKVLVRRQEIKDRILNRRKSTNLMQNSTSSLGSFAEESYSELVSSVEENSNGVHASSMNKTKIDYSKHSVDTFSNVSFSDDSLSERNVSETDNSHGEAHTKKVDLSQIFKEKEISDDRLSLLSEQVNNLLSENKDLRKQLEVWQDKVVHLRSRQSKDRKKFENSADLITKARLQMTKAMNESSTLKGKVNELHFSINHRDRTIKALNDTIDTQADKISKLHLEMKDADVELRHYENEKRRLEEERDAIVASSQGIDLNIILNRLEEERSMWLVDKERSLETKRQVLDAENARALERNRQQYRKETEELLAASEATREREDELERIKESIDTQLKVLKEDNDDLRQRIDSERTENMKESKKAEHTINAIEQEVSKLRRKLASSQLQEQESQATIAELENNAAEILEVKKRNIRLKKQIKKLKENKENNVQGSQSKNDWKEIVLPGYKHLKGVTFGPPSEELAGFLTILVEDQKAKKVEATSQLQSEVRRYLKELTTDEDLIDTPSLSRSTKSGKRVKLKKSRKGGIVIKRQRKKRDIEDYDWSGKNAGKSVKEKSWAELINKAEESLEGTGQSHLRSKKGDRDKRKRRARKSRKIGKGDESSSTSQNSQRKQRKHHKHRRKKSENKGSDGRRYERKRAMKKRNTKRKPRKHGEKKSISSGVKSRHKDSRKKKKKVRIKALSLDDKLRRFEALNTNSAESGASEPEDISLVVMKIPHRRKKKNKWKSRSGAPRHSEMVNSSPSMSTLQ